MRDGNHSITRGIHDGRPLDTSGHRPIFEQPAEFHAVMTDVVLADTSGS